MFFTVRGMYSKVCSLVTSFSVSSAQLQPAKCPEGTQPPSSRICLHVNVVDAGAESSKQGAGRHVFLGGSGLRKLDRAGASGGHGGGQARQQLRLLPQRQAQPHAAAGMGGEEVSSSFSWTVVGAGPVAGSHRQLCHSCGAPASPARKHAQKSSGHLASGRTRLGVHACPPPPLALHLSER